MCPASPKLLLHASNGKHIPKVEITLCRAAGVPARVGFADVRNHLNSEKLRERMGGSDLFIWHGYVEFLLDGWVKVTPAFNIELCERFGVLPLDFDGEPGTIRRCGNRRDAFELNVIVYRIIHCPKL